MYGIKSKCKECYNLSICSYKNIIDITNTTCIPYLLKSQPPFCTRINSQHILAVEEISDDILLLNQYNGSVLIDNETIKLTGTFLIKHQNTTIIIDDQTYISKELTFSKPLPAIMQPSSHKGQFEELLSLEMIKELNVNNTKIIQHLKTSNKINFVINISLIATVIILILLFVLSKIYHFKKIEPIQINAIIEGNSIATRPPIEPETETKVNEPKKDSTSKITSLTRIPLF